MVAAQTIPQTAIKLCVWAMMETIIQCVRLCEYEINYMRLGDPFIVRYRH